MQFTPLRMFTLAAAADIPTPHTTWEWMVAVFYIVWIDIVLAGDNAVVIALAVRNLDEKKRKLGIILGAGAAVALRAALTAVTTYLLVIPYLKLGGGLMILWIAFKLLSQGEAEHGDGKGGAQSIWQAVWMILVADITMSLDNVMAVGGAAHGDFKLIIFGLLLSIPLVVFGSNLISQAMAKYKIIVFIGAAILGKVGGEMIMTDKVTAEHLSPIWANVVGATSDAAKAKAYDYLRYGVEAVLVVGIFLYGWLRSKKKSEELPAAS